MHQGSRCGPKKGVYHEKLSKGTVVSGPSRRGFINITPQVNECPKESGIQEGLALVNAMHNTASVFINDDEPGLYHLNN